MKLRRRAALRSSARQYKSIENVQAMAKRAFHHPLSLLMVLSFLLLIIGFGFGPLGKAMVAEAMFRGRHLPASTERRPQTDVPATAEFIARDLLNNVRR